MGNYHDNLSTYTVSCLQSCRVVKFTDCSWLGGPNKVVIIIQLYTRKDMGGVDRDPHCSRVSKSAGGMEIGRLVIATSALFKTALSASTPAILHFFSLHFNSNQKINISPPSFSVQTIFHPQPHFTGSWSRASFCCDTPKKTVLLNVVDKHNESDARQLTAAITHHALPQSS